MRLWRDDDYGVSGFEVTWGIDSTFYGYQNITVMYGNQNLTSDYGIIDIPSTYSATDVEVSKVDFYEVLSDNIDLFILTLDNNKRQLTPSKPTYPSDDVSTLSPTHSFDQTSRIIGFEAVFSTDNELGEYENGIHSEFGREIKVLKEIKIVTDTDNCELAVYSAYPSVIDLLYDEWNGQQLSATI